MNPLTTYTCKLTEAQAATLRSCLEARHYQFYDAPHAQFAAEKEKTHVVMYTSGKLVVQGKGTRDFVEFVLEPEVLQRAQLGYETVLNPDLLLPRLGVDESGKGDFFGPLCIAGVYVNEAVLAAWKDTGIRDSKRIGSDRQITELAKRIRQTPGCLHTVVAIGNEAYNRLHARMGNVNTLLAWGHARAIENLLGQKHRMNPLPVRAISDQFATHQAVLARALLPLGRRLELVQRHRAEEDPAVAAASILARDEFNARLRRMAAEYGMELPKGAGPAVEEAARAFVARHGADALPRVAKIHFRTARRVLEPNAA